MSLIRHIKILITTPSFPPYNSGLGNAVYQQVKMLTSHKNNVVVATAGNKRNTRFDSFLNVRIEEFNVTGADSLINPLRGDVDSYKMFLLESNFDLILMNAWQTWSTDICLKYLNEISGKKVLYSHCISTNLFFSEQPLKSLLRYLLWRPYFFKIKSILKKLDALICLAPEGIDSRFDDVRMASKLKIPLYIIPNTVSDKINCIDPLPFESRKQIISVGSYSWQKGHDFVLRTYALSIAKNNIPLKIFGQKFSPHTIKLKEEASRLGIENKFLSFYEGVEKIELLKEYSKSLAFILGSRTECQPLVILDAMASGTPYISRSTGCIDLIPGGIAVKNEEKAARSLDKILENEEAWKIFHIKGLKAARTDYKYKTVCERLNSAIGEIYKKL
jgi:glycosyltransferase involved in cell wall biosynthesis